MNLTLSSQRSAARVSFRACADAGLLRAIGTKYSPVTDSRWGDVATYSYTEEKIRNTKSVIDPHIRIGLQYRSTVDSANKAIITKSYGSAHRFTRILDRDKEQCRVHDHLGESAPISVQVNNPKELLKQRIGEAKYHICVHRTAEVPPQIGTDCSWMHRVGCYSGAIEPSREFVREKNVREFALSIS